MALIQNNTPGIRVLNDSLRTKDKDGNMVLVPGSTEQSFTIPRGNHPNENRPDGLNTLEVPDEVVERLRKDPVVAAMFDREDLVVKSARAAKAEPARAEETDKGHGHKR